MNSAKKTSPLPKELTKVMDRQLASHLIVGHLSQIPEFSRLWDRARGDLDVFFEVVLRIIHELVVAPLPPHVRDAALGVLCSQGPLSALSAEQDRQAAEKALYVIKSSLEKASHLAEGKGMRSSYPEEMTALVEPLGIPDLAFTLLVWDCHRWGVDKVLASDPQEIEGPVTDYLRSWLMKSLTDLNVAELARETPAQIRKRLKQKVAPLSYHMQRSKLDQRIHLWIQNKVYGRTAAEISKDRHFGEEWVREQIKEATRILGATVSTGRPRKGGVLREWKTMG